MKGRYARVDKMWWPLRDDVGVEFSVVEVMGQAWAVLSV